MVPSLTPEALAAVPVFPLPGVVLFPGALLPLHIFEPRYREMTRHCLESFGAMAVACVPEGSPEDPGGHPSIARVAGVGRIVEHERLPDGRYLLTLRGEVRASLEELAFVPPFRRARATVLEDDGPAPDAGDLRAMRALAGEFLALVLAKRPELKLSLPSDEPGVLGADLIAQRLVADPEERQALLETRNPRERVRRLLGALASQRAMFTLPVRGRGN
jgi:ATP-dependent Lon protease